ncbi:hypothetical protein [Janthinobacterium lividum]|uniref:hypothetical protein n=1 Tax=Janthinobacterium lividum TaxID=29581 RepID=UPI0015F1C037|nr:hypothetical protein [Janthinobacterium lividum]
MKITPTLHLALLASAMFALIPAAQAQGKAQGNAQNNENAARRPVSRPASKRAPMMAT